MNELEKAGWRQGAVVRDCDHAAVFGSINCDDYPDDVVLVAASHSCDIAHRCDVSEPYVEFMLLREIDRIDGNFSHSKNPRVLHINLLCKCDNAAGKELCFEAKTLERVVIPKHVVSKLTPDSSRRLNSADLQIFANWLAARYSRPTFPTDFNDALERSKAINALRKNAKKTNVLFSGIYIQLNPDRDLKEGESYSVNILGIVDDNIAKDKYTAAEDSMNACAEALRKAGIEAEYSVRNELEVSISVIKRFKRFYYEDLSFKQRAPLPMDIIINQR